MGSPGVVALAAAMCMVLSSPTPASSFIHTSVPFFVPLPRACRHAAASPRTLLCSAADSSSPSSRPTVTLKIAIDANWAVDDTALTAKRFTSPASLDAVHRLRRDSSAVLVGVGTVCRDDPGLTVRRVSLREGQDQPLRVVLDPRLRTPTDSALATDGFQTLLICQEGALGAGSRAGDWGESVEVVGVPDVGGDGGREGGGGGLDLEVALEAMRERGVRELMVEGGPATARGFLASGLVDRAIIIQATSVEFDQQPVPSGITEDTLMGAGLERLDKHALWDGDETTLWMRPGVKWPSGGGKDYSSWP